MTVASFKKLSACFFKASRCRDVVAPAPVTPTKLNSFKTKRQDNRRTCNKLGNVFLVFLCIAELMVPGLGAVCDVVDGSAVNGAKCLCGSVTCTNTTGLICYSNGDGFCRKSGFGNFGYKKTYSNAVCRSYVGFGITQGLLPNKAACEAAAKSMGLDDVDAVEGSWSNIASGCTYGTAYSGLGNSKLRYNTVSTSTASCTSNSDFCLCIAAPVCTQTNGATSNTDACLCGRTGCTAASGLFCYASNSQCSLVAIPDCPAHYGLMANRAACTCSSATCTSMTGLICYSNGGGSCRKTDFGRFGYIQVEGDQMCAHESNRKPLLDKVSCEAAAKSMGLDDVDAVEGSWSNVPSGCNWDGSKLYYNTMFKSCKGMANYEDHSQCTDAMCNFMRGGNSSSCLCLAALECTHTNGARSNTDACLCGGTGCTAASGLFCSASNSQCSLAIIPEETPEETGTVTVDSSSTWSTIWDWLRWVVYVCIFLIFLLCFAVFVPNDLKNACCDAWSGYTR